MIDQLSRCLDGGDCCLSWNGIMSVTGSCAKVMQETVAYVKSHPNSLAVLAPKSQYPMHYFHVHEGSMNCERRVKLS